MVWYYVIQLTAESACVNNYDVTDTLLPHGAAEVSFQWAQRKDMYHIRKLWKHIK